VINFREKLALFHDHWSPKIVAECNGQQLKVVKLQGEFVWHSHAEEDELFLVLAGRLTIRFREGEVTFGPGECLIVPRGLEHCPAAAEEVHLLLIEPAATKHTGDTVSDRTVHQQEWV
jgi:mannose-6-phosphate isomerase-like protein (cupin superfamily)